MKLSITRWWVQPVGKTCSSDAFKWLKIAPRLAIHKSTWIMSLLTFLDSLGPGLSNKPMESAVFFRWKRRDSYLSNEKKAVGPTEQPIQLLRGISEPSTVLEDS